LGGRECGRLLDVLEVGLERMIGGNLDRPGALDLERECGAATDSGSEAVPRQSRQRCDALAPCGRSQECLVGVTLLVEGEDVADDRGTLEKGNTWIIVRRVGPLPPC